MAEEDFIEDEESDLEEQETEEVEQPVEEVDENAIERKERIKEFLRKVEKDFVVLICIFIVVYAPYLIFKVIDKQKEIPADPYIYSISKKIDNVKKAVYSIDEFKLKLDGLAWMIRAQVSMAYDKTNEELAEELEERRLELADKIISIISSKSYYDIDSADKRQFGLKKELINEINSLLDKGNVEDLYYIKFLVTEIKN